MDKILKQELFSGYITLFDDGGLYSGKSFLLFRQQEEPQALQS